MKTASFFTYMGPGRISIARFPPRNTPKGFRVYKGLAPGAWFNSVSREEYEARFGAQLALLTPASVAADLLNLGGGHEPVLLCYERPPFTESNFCHRRMVARWFNETMGIRVPELVSRQQLEAAAFEHLHADAKGVRDDGTWFCKHRNSETGQIESWPLAWLSEAELTEKLPPVISESLGLA